MMLSENAPILLRHNSYLTDADRFLFETVDTETPNRVREIIDGG